MKAVDIMTTKPITINNLANIAEAARVMKENNIRALIVDRVSDQDAYGIITATDISQAIANSQNPETTYVCEVMTKPCIVVNPDLAVEHIAKLFVRAKIRIAPVIKDKLLGIISLSDILAKTNCLTPEITQHESRDIEGEREIESDLIALKMADRIYENWCSG